MGDCDQSCVVVNLVDDTILAYSDPIKLCGTLEFHDS